MSIFDGYTRPTLTDATVPNPDNSEAELDTVEPEENATKEEKEIVDFEKTSATEALLAYRTNRRLIADVKREVNSKINKIAGLYKALKQDGRVTAALRNALLQEGVVDSEIVGDDTAADAKEADAESSPSEIAEKGATEKELVEASMRAQHAAFMKVHALLKNC